MKNEKFFVLVSCAIGLMSTTFSYAQVNIKTSDSVAAKEGGGAHNGPDTSGKSIPFRSDRAIKIKDLNKVISECTRDIFEDLMFQAYNGKVNVFKSKVFWKSWGNKISFDNPSSFQGKSNEKGVSHIIFAKNEGWEFYTAHKYSLKIYEKKSHMFKEILETTFQLPEIYIENTFNEIFVDDFGNYKNNDNLSVKGLEINYPQTTKAPTQERPGITYTDKPDFEQLYNSNTGLPTSFKVNVRGYYNCIISGVQK